MTETEGNVEGLGERAEASRESGRREEPAKG